MNTIIYTRQGSISQIDSGNTEKLQIKSITKYCESNNLNILKSFHDESSGMNYDRIGLQELDKFITNSEKKIDAILVKRLSELGRCSDLTNKLLNRWLDMGVGVVSIDESFNSLHNDPITIRLYI